MVVEGEGMRPVAARLRADGGHLPQIAACADAHFQIEKRVDGGRTRTTVKRLSPEERIDEIGRMLGGELTPAIRATARDILAERAGSQEGPEAKGERAKAKGESESAKNTKQARDLSPKNTKTKNTKTKNIGA